MRLLVDVSGFSLNIIVQKNNRKLGSWVLLKIKESLKTLQVQKWDLLL